MDVDGQEIKCDTFREARAVIKRTAARIKGARNAKERQYYAQDLVLEARILSPCPKFVVDNPDCMECYAFSQKCIQEYEYLAKKTV